MIKTKKSILIGLAALILSFCVLGSGCSERFSAQGAQFYDSETDITYNYAPFCYSPIAVSEEVYGTDGDINFYAIEGKDTKGWLADDMGTVFYAEGETLPAFSQMEISYVEICAKSSAQQVLLKIFDADVIAQTVAYYVGENGIHNPNTEGASSFALRFADTGLGLYYSLDYIVFAQDYIYTSGGESINYGKKFLYNYAEKKFIKAPDILDAYIEAVMPEESAGE